MRVKSFGKTHRRIDSPVHSVLNVTLSVCVAPGDVPVIASSCAIGFAVSLLLWRVGLCSQGCHHLEMTKVMQMEINQVCGTKRVDSWGEGAVPRDPRAPGTRLRSGAWTGDQESIQTVLWAK